MWNNVLVMGIFLALCVGFVKHTDPSLFSGTTESDTPSAYTNRMRAPEGRRYGVVTLFAEKNGHFFADATVNGTHIDFLVDTGASVIALTELDARRIGLDLNALDYRHKFSTANGIAHAAIITLDEVRIGDITVHDVKASVHRDVGLSQSLLGMSLLKKLSSFRMDGTRLVMEQ